MSCVPEFIAADGCAVTFRCAQCKAEVSEVELFAQAKANRSLRPLLWTYGKEVAQLWSCAEASMANGCYAEPASWGTGEFERFVELTLTAEDLTHMPEDSYDATMVLEALKETSPSQAGALVSVFLTRVELADFSPYEDFVFLMQNPNALAGYLATINTEDDRVAMLDALSTHDAASSEAEIDAHDRLVELVSSAP